MVSSEDLYDMGCPFLKYLTAVALVLSSDPIAQTAFAVVVGEDPQSSEQDSELSQPYQITSKKIELPISWQLTRSRMLGATSSTMTETYSETWMLEHSSGIYHLRSPRATIPAFVSEDTKLAGYHVPTSITMSETDFGKLIGLRQTKGTGSLPSVDRPITIQLKRNSKQESEILLTWGDDEHFIVQLDFSPASSF